MEEMSKSPLPKEADIIEDVKVEVGMDFPSAIREVIDGKKITRTDWEDESSFGELKDGFLMIHNKGMHQWIVSEADMLADDWTIIK